MSRFLNSSQPSLLLIIRIITLLLLNLSTKAMFCWIFYYYLKKKTIIPSDYQWKMNWIRWFCLCFNLWNVQWMWEYNIVNGTVGRQSRRDSRRRSLGRKKKRLMNQRLIYRSASGCQLFFSPNARATWPGNLNDDFAGSCGTVLTTPRQPGIFFTRYSRKINNVIKSPPNGNINYTKKY